MNRTHLFFAAAVLVQVLIVAGVPAQKVKARVTGRDVLLKVAPVDPYSIMSGYYMALNYDISRGDRFKGWQNLPERNNVDVYAVLTIGPDRVAAPAYVARAFPEKLNPGEIVLKGVQHYGRITYGLETFYVPEDKRRAIEDDFRAHVGEARAEVVIDSDGNGAFKSLVIQGRVYAY